MSNMVQNSWMDLEDMGLTSRKDRWMEMEKVYKTMKSVGVVNIIFGILMTVCGAVMGSFMIVCGARLLHRKKDLTF